jgi:anti-sigma28 factor (negative regulator of flagellin synthesis)
MSSINGIGGHTPIQKVVSQPIHKQLPVQPATQQKIVDKVQLTHVNQLLATLKVGGDIRADKVDAIRAQLKAGTYESEAKLDAAIDRLIDDLGR